MKRTNPVIKNWLTRAWFQILLSCSDSQLIEFWNVDYFLSPYCRAAFHMMLALAND